RNAWLVPFLPLAGAAIAAAGGRWLKGRSHWPVVLGIGLSFLVSLGILFSFAPAQGHEGAAGEGEAAAVAGAGEGGSGAAEPASAHGGAVQVYRWIDAGNLHIPVELRVDGLSTMM